MDGRMDAPVARLGKRESRYGFFTKELVRNRALGLSPNCCGFEADY